MKVVPAELGPLPVQACSVYVPDGAVWFAPSSPARVSAHGARDPGKPAWPEHFLHSGGMSLSANHSSSLMFTNAFNSMLIFMTF